jgi:hypothetical protein
MAPAPSRPFARGAQGRLVKTGEINHQRSTSQETTPTTGQIRHKRSGCWRREDDGSAPVPVLISAAAYDTRVNWEDWLARHLAQRFAMSAGSARLVRDRRVLPLLDGVDELDPVGQPERARMLIAGWRSWAGWPRPGYPRHLGRDRRGGSARFHHRHRARRFAELGDLHQRIDDSACHLSPGGKGHAGPDDLVDDLLSHFAAAAQRGAPGQPPAGGNDQG